MGIYEYLKANKEDILFVDRTGNIVVAYLKGDVKVMFEFNSINTASRKFREYRRELEGIMV